MLKKLLCTWFLLAAVAIGGHLSAQPGAGLSEGIVRVKLQPEVGQRIGKAAIPAGAGGIVTTGVTQLDRVNQKVKAVRMTRVFPYSPKFEERHKRYGLDLWYEIRFDNTGMTPAEARNLYKAVPGIQIAESVRPMKLIGGERFLEVSPAAVARASKAAASMPFNDPLLPQQWHYSNDGSIAGTVAGADANVFKGWEVETGKKDVLVAIIDGGFQIDHPDLAGNLWVNEAELNGQPGVDDDGNGYVDDVYGYNFVINSADVGAHSHGTHVAGTVGAVNNNGVGVAGVAGGSGNGDGVRMMSCAVFDSRASSSVGGDYAAALVYAADMGASIAQCSWGWATADYYEQAVLDAVKYFTREGGGDKMKGGLCIFANGNTGDEGDYYPACMPEVVAVGSMTATKQPAYYSTRGAWCDVTAPGGLLDSGEKYGVLSTLPNGTYGYNEGTSMACPHVSGIAALILSKFGNGEFSNETLRTQLVTSVNDLYTDNPEYEGLFGSGYIDAYKALQMGSGAAPEAVGEFTLTPSQDNVLIEWNIPASEENMVDHHVIYYSTETFTAESDLSKLSSVTVDTKFQSSGDPMQYELGGLLPLTRYYIAIVAYNRWGNGSSMSPVKEAQTNAGPEVSIDKDALDLKVDAAQSGKAEGEFTISNDGQGILKYSLSAATKSVAVSASSLNAPDPGNVVPFSGAMSEKAAPRNTVVSADYRKEDWPVKMTWSEGIYSYLGESDQKKPNALAQYFYVNPETYPDGFNLTALNFGGYGGSDPVIEIYNGSSSISVASLLQKVDYTFFAYNYDIALSEQIFFEPGSSFWVVAKFPVGQKNPLGAGMANTDGIKQYSFFSSDDGKTWTQLSEVLKGGNYEDIADQMTWDVAAISQNPDWSVVLNPEPAEGTVRPGEKQTVRMSNDGQQLVNGTYTFRLKVNTNEMPEQKRDLTVKMTVTGYKPELSSKQLIDFGDLLVGQSKTLSVELVNNGYGAFAGQWGALYPSQGAVTCTSDQFEMPAQVNAIAARSKSSMDVTFKPTKAGSVSGTVTLTDKNGLKHSFTVRGVAAEPAKVSVDKTEVDLGDLEVGGADKTGTFSIKNEGQYPLEYAFPKFSSKAIEGASSSHKFGYTYISNLNGSGAFAYDGNPELTGETDITSQFNDNNWQSEAVSLGFKFPFYGTDYEKVYVSSHGGVMMQTIDGRISCMVPTATCVNNLGYISAYANSGHLEMGGSSKVSYGRLNGNFVVKFSNVLTSGTDGAGGASQPISFHIVLCPDGSVELHYDDYDPSKVFGQGSFLMASVSDISCEDVFVVTDNDLVNDENSELYKQFGSGTAVKIVAPAKSMIKSLSSADGVVGIGETKEITVTASAGDDLYAGSLENILTMTTNDPASPSVNIVLKANITGDLHPDAALDTEILDFGKVFRTSEAKRSMLLSNNGRNTLSVTGVKVKDGKFKLADDLSAPFTVAPGRGKDIVVTLPTDAEGEVSDVMTISFADGDEKTVPLSGTVIGTPEWAVNPEQIEVSTPYGVNVDKELTVSNGGNEPLEFGITPEDWFNVADLTADGEASSVDYVFKANSDGDDVPFEWIDITSDYDSHQPMSYYLDKTDYYTLELPFDFTFYGKKYKTMYVYNTGFVSFDKPETDYKQFPEPPASIPTTDTFYKNIIAPFWGNHTMGSPSTDGTYIKNYDDHVVVSYINYGNSAMMGMDFQLILNNDGTFKFQYKLQPTGMMIGVYGLCGVQDATGTRGVNPPDQYISSGNALMFYPVKKFTVAPGEEAKVPVTLLADELAGTYEHEISFSTNVPGKEDFRLPVKLEITGDAKPVFPETLDIEQTIDPSYNMGVYDFTVSNEGNRAFTITGVQSEMFDMDPATWAQEAQLMVYAESNGGIDPGPLSLASGEMGWVPVTNALPVTVGKEPVRFRICLMNVGTVHAKDYDITFTTEGLPEAEKVIKAKVNVTDMPQIGFDKEELKVFADEADYVTRETMNIINNGAYKLTYSLRLDPTGRDEETENQGGGIAPGLPGVYAPAMADSVRAGMLGRSLSVVKSAPSGRAPEDEDPYPYDYPEGEEFTNLIYYPMMKPWNSARSAIMGTGSDLDDNFYAATRFVAPAEGFNLSKLYFTGTVGSLENVDIEATVVQGGDVTADKVITGGKLRVEREEPAADGNYYGTPRMLTFDRPVYINPADTFYVVLKYPAGFGHSALLASRDGVKSAKRCMGYLTSMGGWFDLEELLDAEYGYGPMGYFMTCVETEPGKPWIKLLDTDTEGEIEPGGSKTVTFEIDAAQAYFDRNNRATLVIRSNDPMNKLVNYHVTLDKNGAPAVTVPEGTVTVPEAAEAVMPVTVADAEGDAFTVSVSDDSGIAAIGSFTNAEGTQDGVTEADGVISVEAGKSLKLNISLKPGYGTAGSHTVTVMAADAKTNSSATAVVYNVEHVNRAPVYTGAQEITVYKGQNTGVMSYATMFTDPDGEDMTFEAAMPGNKYAELMTNEYGFMLMGNAEGDARLTLKATDASGGATSVTVAVKVSGASGIGSVDTGGKDITAYPNPVVDRTSVTMAEDADNVTYSVYDNGGRLVGSSRAAHKAAGEPQEVDMSRLGSGIYRIVVAADGRSHTVTVVKK